MLPLAALAQTTPSYEADNNRVALVIGNSAYEYITPLANPRNDAAAIAEKLWEAGFEVIEAIDVDRESMLASIATFRSRLRRGSDALFFYAGHGVRVGATNYLLPISVSPTSVDELRAQSVAAQYVIDAMSASGARLNVVILDACRNNPFERVDPAGAERLADRAIKIGTAQSTGAVEQGLIELSKASDSGLAEMSAGSTETLIGFATAPGAVALDGDGRHSPYTQSILGNIDEPGLEIGQLFRKVRGSVRELTDGAQISWTTSTLESDFYFKPLLTDLRAATAGMTTATDTLGTLPPRRVVDRAFWRAIEGSDRIDAFVAYVRTRPDGAFVPDAIARVVELGGDPEVLFAPDPLLVHPEIPAPAQPSASETAALREELGTRSEEALAIGVGARDTILAMDTGRWIHVTRAPRLGATAGPGGEVIGEGAVVWVAGQSGFTYGPKVGSNGGIDSMQVAELGDGGSKIVVETQVETFVHACDLLAGMEQDSQRVTAGARQFIVDRNFDAAIVVCEIAVEQYPDVPRFWAQLARAYRSAGRYDEALKWQLKAVNAGYLAAQINLGQMYLDAQAVPRDYDRARVLFLDAAEKGESAAYTAMGWIYRAGVGVEQSYAKALEWYQRGADASNDWAMTNIAEMYQNGKGVPQDPLRAVEWYTRAAKSGELTAQTRLARMYQNGDGVPADYERARFWFETAAGRGVPNALTRLGIMYETGQGVDRDVEGALRLYTRAAREGDDEAFYRLGRLFADPELRLNDPAHGAKLLERAAARDVPSAHRDLGRLYEEGRGVAKDHAQALSLYKIAAESNPWSARDVARLYTLGDGVAQDFAQAAVWYERAARGGVSWAARDLAQLYEKGLGVPTDPIRALIWYGTAKGLATDETLSGLVGNAVAGYDAKTVALAVQTLLNELGHEVGTPDGVVGPATQRALAAAFTSRGREPVSGPVGFETIVALTSLR